MTRVVFGLLSRTNFRKISIFAGNVKFFPEIICVTFFVQVWFALTLEGGGGAVVELELEWCGAASLLLWSPRSLRRRFRLLSHYVGCLNVEFGNVVHVVHVYTSVFRPTDRKSCFKYTI